MSWNYRVLEIDHLEDNKTIHSGLSIHEVYYRSEVDGEELNNIDGWTKECISLRDFDSLDELDDLCSKIKDCLEKPILKAYTQHNTYDNSIMLRGWEEIQPTKATNKT